MRLNPGRVDIRALLARPDLRRELLASVSVTTQAREGIDSSPEQARQAAGLFFRRPPAKARYSSKTILGDSQ